MRNALRRKPLHRLLLSATIASLIAVPAAFATAHHGAHNVSTRAASHASSRHHAYADNGRSAKRSSHRVNRNSQSVADSSQQRRHVHVPDEEELAQPEL